MTTDKLVYSPGESLDLQTLFAKASQLSELLEQEEARIKASEEKAHESGFEKGQAEGYEAALGHIALKLLTLSKEADEARSALEKKSTDMAISIVEKIADDMGTTRTIASLAASAARQMVPREPVVLRVSVGNLEEVEHLISTNPAFRSRINEVTGDPALQDQDCILETEFGQIKANLDIQLNSIREHLKVNG